jgi:hypothetical protein
MELNPKEYPQMSGSSHSDPPAEIAPLRDFVAEDDLSLWEHEQLMAARANSVKHPTIAENPPCP